MNCFYSPKFGNPPNELLLFSRYTEISYLCSIRDVLESWDIQCKSSLYQQIYWFVIFFPAFKYRPHESTRPGTIDDKSRPEREVNAHSRVPPRSVLAQWGMLIIKNA